MRDSYTPSGHNKKSFIWEPPNKGRRSLQTADIKLRCPCCVMFLRKLNLQQRKLLNAAIIHIYCHCFSARSTCPSKSFWLIDHINRPTACSSFCVSLLIVMPATFDPPRGFIIGFFNQMLLFVFSFLFPGYWPRRRRKWRPWCPCRRNRRSTSWRHRGRSRSSNRKWRSSHDPWTRLRGSWRRSAPTGTGLTRMWW